MTQAKEILKAELLAFPGIDDNHPDLAKVILLLGTHGVGKSRIVDQACDESGVEFGPWHVGATGFEDNLGLQEIVAGKDGVRRTLHRASAGIPGFDRAPVSRTGRGCLFHDEVFTGTVEHQNQLRAIISRRMGELKLDPGWIQVAASNPFTSDYSTVQEVDEALASRFVIICVEPTDDEKLAYWRRNNILPDQLYAFLTMNKMLIAVLDSRAWANVGHSLRKWHGANLSQSTITKLLMINAGKNVAAQYELFVKRGSDPDNYPINATDLVHANDAEHRVHLARIKQWIKAGDTATIGATEFDIRMLMSDSNNSEAVQKLLKVKKVAASRIVDVIVLLLDEHKALAADLVAHVKDGPMVNAVHEEICSRGDALAQTIMSLSSTAQDWANKKVNT